MVFLEPLDERQEVVRIGRAGLGHDVAQWQFVDGVGHDVHLVAEPGHRLLCRAVLVGLRARAGVGGPRALHRQSLGDDRQVLAQIGQERGEAPEQGVEHLRAPGARARPDGPGNATKRSPRLERPGPSRSRRPRAVRDCAAARARERPPCGGQRTPWPPGRATSPPGSRRSATPDDGVRGGQGVSLGAARPGARGSARCRASGRFLARKTGSVVLGWPWLPGVLSYVMMTALDKQSSTTKGRLLATIQLLYYVVFSYLHGVKNRLERLDRALAINKDGPSLG